MRFPHTASIQRLVTTGDQHLFQASGSSACFLQPLSRVASQAEGISFGKGFNCYLPVNADVMEGDRLVINGVTYGVRGLTTWSYGKLAHKIAMLEFKQ